jgi:hypothetical protein
MFHFINFTTKLIVQKGKLGHLVDFGQTEFIGC